MRTSRAETGWRVVFLVLAATHLGLGVWMLFSPHTFFGTIGAFDAYNPHYARDTATFYLGFGLGSLVAVSRSSWRVPVLVITTAQYAVHTVNHAIDVDRANNSWAGPFDLVALALATVQLAALLVLLVSRRRAERFDR